MKVEQTRQDKLYGPYAPATGPYAPATLAEEIEARHIVQ